MRRNLFFIICGVVGAGGVALGVVGLRGMPKVEAELKNVGGIYDALGRIEGSPTNRDRIEAEQRRIDRIISDRDSIVKKAKTLYGYTPLVPEVFPSGNALARIEFRQQYMKAMTALLPTLRAGMPATQREIAAFKDRIENESVLARDEGVDLEKDRGSLRTPAGVLTAAGVRLNPRARANIAKAQQLYCYALPLAQAKPPLQAPALDYQKAMINVSAVDAPLIDEVWWAQIGYWIQQDVVKAIATVNEAAAEAARTRGEETWVGNLPVKEVISIRVSAEYVSRDSEDETPGDPPVGFDPASPPGTPETVFTHSGQTSWYEVRQFTLKLVMDERDVPALIAELCTDTFHNLLRVAYQTLAPDKDFRGKVYGPEPVVIVVLDFETIMLGDVFRPLMPTATCDYYEINCPERDEAEDDG